MIDLDGLARDMAADNRRLGLGTILNGRYMATAAKRNNIADCFTGYGATPEAALESLLLHSREADVDALCGALGSLISARGGRPDAE